MLIQVALLLGALWLGSLLVFTGSTKMIVSPHQNARSVEAYKILPRTAAQFVGAALPYAEILGGTLLLLTPLVAIGGYVAFVLGSVFAFASASVLLRDINTSCGCAGGSSERVTTTTLSRAVVIAASALAVMAGGTPVPPVLGWITFGVAISPP